jgi:hypothetical protein
MALDDLFRTYATKTLGARPFDPREDEQEELAFAASLNSFRQLHAGDWGGVNASGQSLMVAVGYIEAMTPNAFAEASEAVHFIGMHDALLVTMMDLALFAFTQSGLFPTIGDAASEASPPPRHGGVPGLYLLEMTLRGETVEPDLARHRVPQCADRHVAAVYLAMHMARFVWEHELAHCRLGHAAFLKRHGNGARLTEAPDGTALVKRASPTAADDLSRSLLHAFELEADAEALRACLAVQLSDAENIPGIRALDPGLRIQMAIFAAYLMTWLFEAYGRHAETASAKTHPEPLTRLASLMATTRSILGGVEGFEDFHKGVLDQVETLIDALGVDTAVRPSRVPAGDGRVDTRELLAPFQYAPVS